MASDERIVVFDGMCNFCSRSMRFILEHDVRGRLRFAPLQSPIGRRLLETNGIDPADAQTFLLVAGNDVYVRSDAALEIARDLGAWRWLRVLKVIPRGLRDWMYTVLARNRYRWFGRRDVCFVPTPEQRARFSVASAVVRPARVEDAADVVRVLRASRLRFLPYAPPVHSEAEDLEWARNSLLSAGGVTVATAGDKLIGVLAVSRAEGASWIDQLYVQPEYCGRGVGSQLMAVALSSLPRPIRLFTFQQNDGARRFYERFGFLPIEWSDGSGNEERCPDVLYELVDRIADDVQRGGNGS